MIGLKQLSTDTHTSETTPRWRLLTHQDCCWWKPPIDRNSVQVLGTSGGQKFKVVESIALKYYLQFSGQPASSCSLTIWKMHHNSPGGQWGTAIAHLPSSSAPQDCRSFLPCSASAVVQGFFTCHAEDTGVIWLPWRHSDLAQPRPRATWSESHLSFLVATLKKVKKRNKYFLVLLYFL